MKIFIKRFWVIIVTILLAAMISGLLSDDPLKAMALFILQYIQIALGIVLVYLACLMAVRKAISEIRIMEITEEENDKDHG